jgi:hypothetical protein
MDIIFLFLIIICKLTTGCTSYKRYNLIIRRQPRNTLVLTNVDICLPKQLMFSSYSLLTNVYNKSSLCRLLTLPKIFHLMYTYHLLQFLSKNCLYTSFILGLLPFMCSFKTLSHKSNDFIIYEQCPSKSAIESKVAMQ